MTLTCRNKSDLIDSSLLRFIDDSVVACFFGHPVYFIFAKDRENSPFPPGQNISAAAPRF